MSGAGASWQGLLRLALPALDHVFGREPGGDPSWTMGGGTALAIQLDHRISHDIDIFVQRGTGLKAFTPRENPFAAAISTRYQWPGHYLKFERPEGEVDFLGASLLTTPGFGWWMFEGRRIALETPEEVIVKKVRYRAADFTARDAFDLAAVAATQPNLATVLAAEVDDALLRLREAVRVLAARGPALLAQAIVPTASGAVLAPTAVERARLVVEEAIRVAADRVGLPGFGSGPSAIRR